MQSSRFVLACILLMLLGLATASRAQQQITITGKVTDAGTGEALPFVNVVIKKTTIGVTSDFDGNYKIILTQPADSLTASYIGYFNRSKKITAELQQHINFQLTANAMVMGEVEIRPGENPAWPIMREVIRHKNGNDKRSLTGYEYESYNRVEIDADNISARLAKRKAFKRIKDVMDSIQVVAGEDGKPVFPIFMSEAVTAIYTKTNPQKQKEQIIKTKVSGIGFQSSSILNQMIGSTFQEYNFYRNWLNIFQKYFVSPIADGWRFYYDYELQDSLTIAGDLCYRIKVTPKRPQDLAFTGTIWIAKADYALKQIDCYTGKDANINFIDKIKIQQVLVRTETGAWLPSKNRVLLDIAQFDKNTAGLIAKFYTSNRNFLVNKPKDNAFFDQPVVTSDDANVWDDKYWQSVRHDPLTHTEQNIFKMIDTVQRLPVVRTYVEVANIAVNGYKKIGPIDFGPYLYTYTLNNVEGSRFRLGFRTNQDFSRRLVLRGYGAYGIKDGRFKYEASAEYILSRKHWTVFGSRYNVDLQQLGLLSNSIAANNLFNAFARYGRLNRSRPFYLTVADVYATSEIRKGLTLTAELQDRHYDFTTPIFKFNYADGGETSQSFNTTEAIVSLKFAPDETWLQNSNGRISLGAFKYPITTVTYAKGLKGVMGGNFDYDRFGLTLVQFLNLGYLGKARYAIDAGLIPNTLPYPLLRAHLGNQTIFYNASSFNQMRYFEFVSDHWAQLNYQHFFEGFLVNSIPLVKKWNLRLLATGNVLYGGLRSHNLQLATQTDTLNYQNIPPVKQLEPYKPYVEVGYGVENIFRFIRVDFIHRLTYLAPTTYTHYDQNNVRITETQKVKPFGIKVSVQFKI